ncbi:adenosine kinase [Bombella saccharophila]|uniref:Adenosine kinase n=1 Tax=Bombella saccharophila TaxID=2967338 RepID=A0ABT3W744_9PROT|nr:adenosine kinase [Bombella saccharophila]MCX5614892.1 adenosine kinase [Bombella saccharophila]PHI96392.1 carbohydrate kinase [Parasaccharibacter apium]
MSSTALKYDLLCIGNAIVDVLATVTPELLAEFGAAPGSMTLIDAATMAKLEQRIHIEHVAGGGSAANSAVVAARMGAKTAYLGKVAADKAGEDFTADLRKQGIDVPSTPLAAGEAIPTARCIVLITPDGQRTMFTYLGACVEFTPHDVLENIVAESAITYLEGYLFDRPQAQEAFYQAARLAHKAGRKVSLTLSDSFCIQRHQAAFRDFVAESVDILFANEAEILALYETETLDDALKALSHDVALGVVTRGEKGAVIQAGEERHDVPTKPVKLVDTTGAGDAFAAGFLAGYSRHHSLVESARLGNEAAGHVIARLGGRPGADFALKA